MRAWLLLALTLTAGEAWAVPSFVKESGVRKSSATAQSAARAYADPKRVYYVRESSAVYSATTTDGIAFTEEAGIRLSSHTVPALDIAVSSITGVTVFSITGGGYRMLYSVIGTTNTYRIYSATSADGFAWANETGTIVGGGSTFVGFPSVVQLASGDHRLYYVQNSIAGDQAANHQIFTALSTNQGRNWGSFAAAVATTAGEVSATKLTNGKVRLYYSAPASVGAASNTVVNSALSSNSNGTSFTIETGTRLSTTSALTSPFVTISTDGYRWRMYYTYVPPQLSTGDITSATTEAPDPQLLTPSTVFNTAASRNFTLTGEIFSPNTTSVILRGSGQPDIVGTNVTWVDDQTITVDFATNGAASGYRDIIVTTPGSLLSTTLSNALLIDYPGGSVQLTDNLFRPNRGQQVRVDVTTYEAGPISAKLYTIDGRFVSTLYDAHQTAGTFTLNWNGRTSGGGVAASGVYILRTTGPKLDNLSKIILIK